MIEGGLIKSSGTLYLPASGKLFKNTTYSEPPTFPSGKYDSALIGYNNIAGSSGLAEDLAQALSITYSGLGISGCSFLPLTGIPLAANHSVTHDYSAGTINFTTVYNNKKACQGNGVGNRITNSTIVIDEPLPRIAQFVVPGKKSGPIIQRIGTDTPRYITVTVEGVDHNAGCVSPKSVIENICANGIVLTENSGYPLKLYYDDFIKKGMKLVDNKYAYNRTDGSYSIVRKYLSYNYLENPVNDDGTFVMGGNNPGRFNFNDYEEVGKP